MQVRMAGTDLNNNNQCHKEKPMQFDPTKLFCCQITGMTEEIGTSYDDISGYISGYIEAVQVGPAVEFFIDEEGMLKQLPLNVPASMFASRPLYGPVVLMGTDESGESIPTDPDAKELLYRLASMWKPAFDYGNLHMNQVMAPLADSNNIPPPMILELDKDLPFDEAIKKALDEQ